MRVIGERPADQLDDDDAAHPADDLRLPRLVDAAALHEGAVGAAQARPLVEQGIEVPAAVFLFALHEEADPAGQGTDRGQVRLDGPDPRQQLALVVTGAPGEEAAVADSWLVRRGRPQLERHGRLHVVMLDRVEGPRPGPDLAHHEGWDLGLLGQRDDIHGRADAFKAGGDPRRGRAQPRQVALLGAEATELEQLAGPRRQLRLDVAVQGGVSVHRLSSCGAPRHARRRPGPRQTTASRPYNPDHVQRDGRGPDPAVAGTAARRPAGPRHGRPGGGPGHRRARRPTSRRHPVAGASRLPRSACASRAVTGECPCRPGSMPPTTWPPWPPAGSRRSMSSWNCLAVSSRPASWSRPPSTAALPS